MSVMSEQQGPRSLASSAKPNSTQKRAPPKSKSRDFFQQMQPTFAIAQPRATTTLLFLDENDPAKDTIVRKKAREWVNKNKGIGTQNQRRQPSPKDGDKSQTTDKTKENTMQMIKFASKPPKFSLDPLQGVGTDTIDPFSILPDIGRKYDHIIEWFLKGSCPEEIPCSDDKVSEQSKRALIPFSNENTILGNMARSELTFVLWLYATVTIRDGMTLSCYDTHEIQWFYNRALKLMQECLQKESDSGVYSDHILNALSCITATAVFAGMFDAAELHRDALIRVLAYRGKGNIMKGILRSNQWGRKAMQWCEIMVAAQIVELPKIPYFHPYKFVQIPTEVVLEADNATINTISNLPDLSDPLPKVIRLLHQLGIGHVQYPPGQTSDAFMLHPLYDAEYSILETLTAQKERQCYSEVEVLLAEALQLYFWTGPRTLPPQTRLCDLLVTRTVKALRAFLRDDVPKDGEGTPKIPTDCHPLATNNVIVWSLALSTIVSSTMSRPEHQWLKGQFCRYYYAMKLDDDKNAYQKVLDMFPTTNGFSAIDLRTLCS